MVGGPNCFVIWFEERSGSSLLASLLDTHEHILCRGENFDGVLATAAGESAPPGGGTRTESDGPIDTRVLDGVRLVRKLSTFGEVILGPTDRQCLDHLAAIFSRPRAATGFRFKHPRQDRLYPEVTRTLRDSAEDVRVIHLQRENVVKRAVSKQNMIRVRRAGGLANVESPVVAGKLHVDVDEALAYCDRVSLRRTGFEAWCRPFTNVLAVEYEDLLRDRRATINGVLDFLDVAPDRKLDSALAGPDLVKITPDSLGDAVANYDELVAAFRGSPYEPFVR